MSTAVAPTGLTAAEVAERVASGQVNDVPPGWAMAAILALVVAAGAGLAAVLRRVRRAGERRAQRS
jgi:hypothetical protein